MVYDSKRVKISGFNTAATLELPDKLTGLQNGGNVNFPTQVFLDKISSIYGASLRTYEFKSELVADDIQLGEYALVEETYWSLYKITNDVADAPNIALTSGLTATREAIFNPDATDYADLQAKMAAGVYAAGDVVTVLSPSGPPFQMFVDDGVTHYDHDGGITITQTGSTTVAGEFAAVRQQVGLELNALWYEVKGDGITDDYTNAMKAINACAERLGGVDRVPISKTVYFPYTKAGYKFNTPLNLSADNGDANRRGVTIRGDARPAGGDWGYGTKFIFETSGKAMAEIIDNDGITIKNILFEDAPSNGATVGIYQARRTSGISAAQWTGNCRFENCVVRFLNDDRAYNGNFGTIGIINVAGEETDYNGVEVWANCPLVLTYSNTFRKLKDAAPAAEGAAYDSFEYDPVHAASSEITEGFSNTVFRTNNCRFIAKGRNAPTVLLHEVGSYFPKGDFLQKRDALTTAMNGNGTNSTAYECWNINQMVGDSICESHRTLMMFHRQANEVNMKLRGADDGSGINTIGLIHFASDATGFGMEGSRIDIDYPGTIPGKWLTYTAPVGVGALEPSVYALKNNHFTINKSYDKTWIDPKLPYVSDNCRYDFSDFYIHSDNRRIRFPIKSKSIGAPATTTDLIFVEVQDVAAGFSGMSFSLEGKFEVSNAEVESAGLPSSMSLNAKWQFVRDQNASSHAITNATYNQLTASTGVGGNNITDLTLSSTVVSNRDVTLKVASVQGGANGATAYISGSCELVYAGGYASTPVISLL